MEKTKEVEGISDIMNQRGNFYIPRIGLLIAIIVVVTIAVAIIATGLSKSSNKQKNEMQNVADMLNEVLENNVKEDYTKLDEGITKEELPIIEINTIAVENSTIDGRVPCFYNPVIPKGFKAVTISEDKTIDEKAKWGEQNAYLYGLVIEDAKGNQFVWIPVENINIFKATDWQKNAPKETIDSTYVEPIDTEEEAYQKMYYKVKKYGGFYIGRYETGDLTAESERTTVRNSDSIGVKKYLNAYNYVPFKLSTINKREITGAQELAIKFGKENGYDTITTSVMYGTQWDSMLRFIVSDEINVNDSISWGNYSTSQFNYTDAKGRTYLKEKGEVRLIKTGSSEQTKAKNIYDVAGNAYEWTIESSGKGVRVVRGGSYVVNIGQLAAARYSYNENTANNAIGFRISFYIN